MIIEKEFKKINVPAMRFFKKNKGEENKSNPENQSGITRPDEKTENESTAVHEVTIILEGEEFKVTVPEEMTILEAALEQDIDMPFSCQSGVCSACRGKLLEGEVDMEEDDGLSEEELEEGYILNCVSKPLGPGVKVEIG